MATRRHALLLLLLGLASACGTVRYPVLPGDSQPTDADRDAAGDARSREGSAPGTYPVDLVFVVDNSNSMEEEQAALAAAFPQLIEGLRHPKLGGKLPDLRIGVISSDLGAGGYPLATCTLSDGGKLQSQARLGACPAPKDPWISYSGGLTNIPSGPADPVERVKVAFSCIATLGTGGCGFEQPLESLRRGLDPKLKVNPGFLRDEALLVIFLITDEDDCSASDLTLFDPDPTAAATLGPLDSFRCARFGLVCSEPLTTVGAKAGCKPGGDKLFSTSDYVSFFSGLKPAGKVILAALAGPTSFVKVGLEGANLKLEPTCQSLNGTAVPALRLEAVVTGVGNGSFFNAGIDAAEAPVSLNVCNLDLQPALRFLAKRIVASF